MKKDLVEALLKKVNDDYEYSAEQFSHTRQWQWDDTDLLSKHVKSGDSILDWGCGNGRLYQLFVAKDVEYLGIDNCRGLIEKAQAKYPEVDWLLGTDIPYQSFDKIFAIASWHHLPSKHLRQQKLEEFYDRLSEGGYLLLTTWNLRQKKYFWLWFKNNLRNLFTDYELNDILVPWKANDKIIYRYYHSICKAGLIKVVKAAGFKVEECYYSHKGKPTNWWLGRNLIIIAKKV